MSLSAQFQKSQQDILEATRAASVALIDRAMSDFADGFPGAARGIAARALKGKGPSWWQKRKADKWIWKIKGYSDYEMTSKFFESIPGFRKLRDACADPAMDISFRIYITSSDPQGISISIDPTQPFSESRFSYSSNFCRHMDGPIPRQAPAPATAVPVAATVAPAADDGKITVMTPIRLK